jgi:hypothetical protein
MATFAALANKLRVKVDYSVDKIQLFREAEDNFIEQTNCVETVTETSCGTTTDLINLPDRCLKVWRVTWEGSFLEPLPQGSNISIFDTDDEEYTGTPTYYWIENEDFRLIPKPAESGTLRIWSTNYSASDATSPTIPTIEQNKLINHVMATILEMEGEEKRATYYWTKYQADVVKAKIKYINQRFSQGRYVYDSELGQYIGTSNVINEYVWKKVEFTETGEQTFTTGTSPLSLSELDSGQTVLPTFSGNVKAEVTASYQDRDAYISTDATVSNGTITFGVTRSSVGGSGVTTCYYDISVYQMDS